MLTRTADDDNIKLYSTMALQNMKNIKSHPQTKNNYCPFLLSEIEEELEERNPNHVNIHCAFGDIQEMAEKEDFETEINFIKNSQFGCRNCLWNGCECKSMSMLKTENYGECSNYTYYD